MQQTTSEENIYTNEKHLTSLNISLMKNKIYKIKRVDWMESYKDCLNIKVKWEKNTSKTNKDFDFEEYLVS